MTDVATDGTVGSAELVELGLVPADVARYAGDGTLRSCAGGGTGFPYRFPPSELGVARAILAWRAARDADSVTGRIAEAARDQLAPAGEATTTHVVTVDLGRGVHLVLELEP
jgi:hypothetical protein